MPEVTLRALIMRRRLTRSGDVLAIPGSVAAALLAIIADAGAGARFAMWGRVPADQLRDMGTGPSRAAPVDAPMHRARPGASRAMPCDALGPDRPLWTAPGARTIPRHMSVRPPSQRITGPAP